MTGPRVTLSFDNGPTPGVTEAVLDALRDRNVPATFFAVGVRVAAPGGHELLQRAHAEGHRVGNHTRTHVTRLGDIDNDSLELANEIDGCQHALGPLGSDRLFRPYGRGGVIDEHLLGPNGLARLAEGKFTCVLWNAVPRDWENPDDWVDVAISQVQSQTWSLVVLHDTPTGAMRHLPTFLARLAAADVDVVAEMPPDCVVLDRGVPGPGLAFCPWLVTTS
jgi:peptidoglycan-N-acetylglucosamine deacetylase